MAIDRWQDVATDVQLWMGVASLGDVDITLGLIMKPDYFVQALKQSCLDGAVQDCVESSRSPPGRKPRQELIRISQWFNALPASDREFVVAAMREACDATLFSVLCVIDGVRPIEPEGEKSQFKLFAARRGAESQISPNETYLHDLLRAEP